MNIIGKAWISGKFKCVITNAGIDKDGPYYDIRLRIIKKK